jgi:hypothetical protein
MQSLRRSSTRVVGVYLDAPLADGASFYGVSVTNLLELAIDSDDGDHAAKIIRAALGIEPDQVANYTLQKHWPDDRNRRARVIGERLRTEARFLAADD